MTIGLRLTHRRSPNRCCEAGAGNPDLRLEARDGTDAARLLNDRYELAIIFMIAHELDGLERKLDGLVPAKCFRKLIVLEELLQAMVQPRPLKLSDRPRGRCRAESRQPCRLSRPISAGARGGC